VEIVKTESHQSKLPIVPDEWNYEDSVLRIKPLVFKWKNLTIEVVNELYIAREKMSNRERTTTGTFVPMDKTWMKYCQDIGIEKRTANRWINNFNKPKIEQKGEVIEIIEVDTDKEESHNLSRIKLSWNMCNKHDKRDFIKWVNTYFNEYLK
jgi:ribosomal protein S19E (S16A)